MTHTTGAKEEHLCSQPGARVGLARYGSTEIQFGVWDTSWSATKAELRL